MRKAFTIMVTVFIMASTLTGCYETSAGDRAGTVTKISKKGLLFKTWEGEIILGDKGSSGNEHNTWRFTVEGDGIAKELKSLAGQQVRVEYRQEFITAFWRADTNYFITKIRTDKK